MRVCAGAFGNGRPHCDLLLSPDHSVFVDEVLIPIRCLMNGRTVAQEERDEVTYWHVELDRHDVLLAEGLPCESYLDTGNRGAFGNASGPIMLHPDFAKRVWQEKACAEQILGGPPLILAKRRVHVQATLLGHTWTNDPDLRIHAQDRELVAKIDAARWNVQLPRETDKVRWYRASAFRRICGPTRRTRPLGVPISRLWLDRREVSLESPALRSGWHLPEPGLAWTDADPEFAVTGVCANLPSR